MNSPISPHFTQGPIGPHLIRMALPVIAGQVVFLVYTLANSYFVSQIDPAATSLISGMGLVFPLFFLFLALAQGLATGTASLVARALGEGNTEALERTGDSALFLALTGALVTVGLFFLAGPQLVAAIAGAGLSPQAIAAGQTFLFWLTPGFGLLLVNQALAGILLGEGKMGVTFAASGLSTVLNLLLDPILIFGCGLGVAGAGLATSLSILGSTLLLLSALMKSEASVRVHFRVSRAQATLVREITRVGAPQALNMGLLSLGFLVLNYGISTLGEDVMNAWTLVGRMDDLILMVGYGLSAALLTLVGQNAAAGHWPRVRQALRTAILYGLVASGALALVYIAVSGPLFSLLSGNPRVVAQAVTQVTAVSWSVSGIVVAIITNALFLGLGRPWPGVALTFVRMELLLAPGVLVLIFVLRGGMELVLPWFALVNLATIPVVWWWGEAVLRKEERQRKAAPPSPPRD